MFPPTPRRCLPLVIFLAATSLLLAACSGGSKAATAPATSPETGLPVSQTGPPAAPTRSPGAPKFTVTVSRELRLIWPAAGAITTYFGPGHPTGIDIALDLDRTSPIQASGPGKVVFTGGDVCCSLGNYVEIEHAGGVKTVYGHLDEIRVFLGDIVRQGDVIGLGGSTGEAYGKHLHFEVHQDGVEVDPLRYLPSLQEQAARTDRLSCDDASVRLEPDSTASLRFLPEDAGGYEIKGIMLTAANQLSRNFEVTAEQAGTLAVSIAIPVPAAALGQNLQSRLDVTLKSGDKEEVVSCQLYVRTWLTLPNPPGTGEFVRGTPTPVPTPTRTPVRGFSTPTPRATQTPFVNPTPRNVVPINPTPFNPVVR